MSTSSQILFKNAHLNRQRRAARAGFTLIEALIAVTITLIMMLALSQGFALMSESISEGRSKLTLSDQLRGISSMLREDLDGMTAGGDPMSESCRSGYLEYLEGALNDFSATLASYAPTEQNVEAKIPASRFGDFDDIIAFTAKAKKGSWFYGEVPYPIIAGQIEVIKGTTPTNYTAEQWATSVTVASDTAEIIYYMSPWGADYQQYHDPATGLINYPLNGTTLEPLLVDNDSAQFVPDRMALCRRVLLVLPELNLPAQTTMPDGSVAMEAQLFYNSKAAGGTQLLADPLGAPGSPNILNYRLGMQHAYQRCDLSVRRVRDGNMTDADPIAANSLEDLQDPRNRFAHCVLPLGSNDTTLPMWSLTGPIPLQGLMLNNNSIVNCGFIFPQFYRQKRVENVNVSNANPVTFDIALSEVLASNCIGFDVKGFDATAAHLFHVGADGIPGDQSTTVLGAPGTDDTIVSGSDPGFAGAVQAYVDDGGANPLQYFIAKQGGFVDLGWSTKTIRSATLYENQTGNNFAWATGAQIGNSWNNFSFLHSNLSMTRQFNPGARLLPASLANIKSGSTFFTTNQAFYQPRFDTFTSRYETDGYFQETIYDGAIPTGAIWRNGQFALLNPGIPPAPNPLADFGANGIDDPPYVGGIDDITEQETSPPITTAMPAIQVLIRVQDSGASSIQQIAVTHELRMSN